MANYTIGDMIYENRIARGYSQEELSFGICSTSSLSRIENNEQTPGRRIFEALTQRLGISDSLYSAYISKDEMEINQLIQQLVWSLERMDFNKSKELVRQMEERLQESDLLNKQYILFAKACILKEQGEDERVFQMLLDAIHLTMPTFVPENGFSSRLLTFQEITLLDNIATFLCNKGEDKIGLELQMDLIKYMDTHVIDEQEKAKKYPLIIYNITLYLGEQERYQEVCDLCNRAIKYCVGHNKLIILPYLLTNKACATAELKDLPLAEELFRQAVILFQVCDKNDISELVQKTAFQKYAIEIR